MDMDSCSRQTNDKWIIVSKIQNYKQKNDIRYVVLYLNHQWIDVLIHVCTKCSGQ